jgi:hypothetical protein
MAGTLRRSRRRRLSQVLTIAVTLLIAAGVAMVWVRVVQTLKEPGSGPKTIGQPGALVWDGRVFTAPAQLKAYLESHGLSYKRWAARHPTAFGAPAPTVPRHTTTTVKTATKATKTVTTPARTVTTPRVAAPVVGDAKSRPLTSMVLTLLLLAGGLVLGGSAALPPRYAPATLQRFYAAPDRRIVALAAATAILMGFGVSFYLS